jgi:hypothetical protein
MIHKIYPHKLARAFLSFDVVSLSSLADLEKSLFVSLAPCGGEACEACESCEALTKLTRLTKLEKLARLTRLARVRRRLPDNAI